MSGTIPSDATEWLREVFGECNRRITEKLSANPNLPEESFDLSWIEHLTHFASPQLLPSGWIVRIEAHYLGGLRHFRNFEVADIGLLYFVRRGGAIVRSKVALLQSKRLYPSKGVVEEESIVDYEIGFARLADPEDLARSLSTESVYHFTDSCKFGALRAGSEQVKVIEMYQEKSQLRVYYQLYCPWTLPHTRRVPSASWPRPSGQPLVGVRVLPAEVVHKLLSAQTVGYSPRVSDLASESDGYAELGWSIEEFVADELAGCREGSPFASINDSSIQNLFYRRSGPIAAAVSITIEAPSTAG